VLIGNTSKSLAFQELFRTKKAPRFRSKQHAGEIHLYLDPSRIFHTRLVLITDGDIPQQSLRAKVPVAEKCHKTIRQNLPQAVAGPVNRTTDSIYSRLLLSFADVFCFFSSNISGFRQIVRYMTAWLDKGQSLTLLRNTYPRIIIVTEKMPVDKEPENEARKAFLWLLREKTTYNLSEQILAINVIALLLKGKVSAEAWYRRLKECLLKGLNKVRRNREETRTLFSATYFAALFRYTYDHFS
jgi:hypothetical protein